MRNGWHAAVLAAALALGGSAYAQASSAGGSTSGSTGAGGTTAGGAGHGTAAGASASKAGGKLDKKLQVAAQRLHASNQGEVQAGQAALSTAQSSEVKQFAQRMVDDHTKTDQQLQQLATTMGVSLQGDEFQKKTKDAQSDLKKAQDKQGAEFDKAYMKMMVKEHERDVKEVEGAAKDARKQNQTELASFLETTHGHLQMHLDEAKRVEKSLDARGSGRASASSSASGDAAGATGSGARSGGMGASSSSGSGGMAGEHGGSTAGTGTSGSATGTSGAATGTSGSGGGAMGGSSSGSSGTTGGAGSTSGSGSMGGGPSGGSTGSGK